MAVERYLTSDSMRLLASLELPAETSENPLGTEENDQESEKDEKSETYEEGDKDDNKDMDDERHDSDDAPLDTPELSRAQKKRTDYEAFDSWLLRNRDNKTDDGAKRVENMTAAYLVNEFHHSKIIESPREYQIELFEKAKQKNIIAVLDTGSGKTLIAALLLRHTIDKELEDRAAQKPLRISFFVVDKVALVFQQHAVLESNLNQPVAKFSGDKADMRWTAKEFWDHTLRDNMAIVCTADILLKCLHHSFVCMDQINLLIFDEAHHTKKNHAYSRIIKDFYAPEPPDRRPKIFGMTASPVDSRSHVEMAAQELESLLHSEIVTVPSDSLLRSVVKPKKEWVLHYHMAIRPPPTKLMEQLRQLLGDQRLFSKNFQFAREALIVLGPWIVDRFWQLLFRAEELAKQEARAEMDSRHYGATVNRASRYKDSGGDQLDEASVAYSANVVAVREASRLAQTHVYSEPSTALLANKTQRLYDTLRDQFSTLQGRNTRCIVFVEQRYTAILLADLLCNEHMRIPNLVPDILIGGGSTDMGANSFRMQFVTISKFKQGLVNCLFATSIAEEGLDIPDCNLIVRFDLYHTMIQYIQSRGRARHAESVFIHMAELGNLEHSCQISESKAYENKMREFCHALPDDRKLQGNDFDMDYFLRNEAGQQTYEVPSTKAKLTYRSSLIILAQFVASLPPTADGVLQAEYSVFHTVKGFVCEVTLPASSPLQHATGRPQSKKQIAKCAAAFAMCLKLHEKKYIDKHLKPIFVKSLPLMRNARLAISSKKQEKYRMRAKPEIWQSLGLPAQLFATVLRLRSPEAMQRPSRPLVLLTRMPMPYLAEIPLFFGAGRSSLVECVPLDVPMAPTDAEQSDLAAYSLQIFDDVFSKMYRGTAADFPYLLAPCSEAEHAFVVATGTSARSIIDWAGIAAVRRETGNHHVYTGDEDDAFFENKFVSDPFAGSRKFYMRRVRRDMKPLDLVPDHVPPPGHRMWNHHSTVRNILNYSVSMWSKSRSRMTFRQEQPVVEAELVAPRRNLLDDRVAPGAVETNTCYLVLETLRVSPLPVEVVAMVYNFPAIIHRLESTLIAMEATRVLGLPEIRPDMALEAVTKDCDNSGEADEAAVNFQAGMGRNYERLELLGDSFLKMATSIALYTIVPDKDEFEYHVQRMCMICNRNLFNSALEMKLEEYIRSKEFGRSWYPPAVVGSAGKPEDVAAMAGPPAPYGLVLQKGKRTQPPSHHALGDKTIADVCEALIGAAYLSTYQEQDLDLAVRAVSAVVKHRLHRMQAYADYHALYRPPEWQTAPATASQVHMAMDLGKRLGYKFQSPRLLRSAFTHPSYPRIYENLPSYQRLEFLGDALLDMAIVDYLFHKFPGKDPQWLTEHKMAMVSNQFLAFLSVTLGFHKHLLSFSGALRKQMLEYVAQVDEERARAEAVAVEAGRPASAFARDCWVHVTRPPKALADIVEAYVGALYVDAGFDYHGAVLGFFRRFVQPYFEDMHLYDTFANKHPVTLAVNILSTRFGCQHWRVVVQETPDVDGEACVTFATKVAAGFLVHGQVLGHGMADSGREAKIVAAKQALDKVSSLGIAAFQALTGCQCHAEPVVAADPDDAAV